MKPNKDKDTNARLDKLEYKTDTHSRLLRHLIKTQGEFKEVLKKIRQFKYILIGVLSTLALVYKDFKDIFIKIIGGL